MDTEFGCCCYGSHRVNYLPYITTELNMLIRLMCYCLGRAPYLRLSRSVFSVNATRDAIYPPDLVRSTFGVFIAQPILSRIWNVPLVGGGDVSDVETDTPFESPANGDSTMWSKLFRKMTKPSQYLNYSR